MNDDTRVLGVLWDVYCAEVDGKAYDAVAAGHACGSIEAIEHLGLIVETKPEDEWHIPIGYYRLTDAGRDAVARSFSAPTLNAWRERRAREKGLVQ